MRYCIGLLIGLFFCGCTQKEDIDVSKYPIITTVHDLADLYDVAVDTSGQFETVTLSQYFDGSFELEYDYELIDSEEYDPLIYSISVSGERNAKEAAESFTILKGTLEVFANTAGQSTTVIDSLDLPGDEYYYALREYDGEPNGLLYLVRIDKNIYFLSMSGLYSSDHGFLYDLILPKIEELKAFELKE